MPSNIFGHSTVWKKLFELYFVSLLLYFWTNKTKVEKKEGDNLFFKGSNQDFANLGHSHFKKTQDTYGISHHFGF